MITPQASQMLLLKVNSLLDKWVTVKKNKEAYRFSHPKIDINGTTPEGESAIMLLAKSKEPDAINILCMLLKFRNKNGIYHNPIKIEDQMNAYRVAKKIGNKEFIINLKSFGNIDIDIANTKKQ